MLALLAVTLGAALCAAAAPDPVAAKVVIASMKGCCEDEAWADAEEAARAELVGLGVAVEMIDSLAAGDRERRIELRTLIAERRAAAALRIVRPVEEKSVGGVEVWIEDRATGKTVVRHLVVGERLGAEEARIAALKAVEALRATVADLVSLPGANGAAATAASPGPARARDAGPRFGLRAGGAVAGGPGGLGPLGAVLVGGQWLAGAAVTLEVDVLVSVGGATVTAAGGRAVCDLALVRGWLLWTPRERWRLRAALGAGAGIAIPWAVAPGTTAQRPDSGETAVAYVGGAGSLGARLTRWLRLRLDARVGALIPEARFLFGDRVVARVGRPLAEGTLALEVQIP